MPNAYDLRELPSIRALVKADDTRDTVSCSEFLDVSQSVLYDIQVYENQVQTALVALICEACPAAAADLAGLDPATALQRYPAAFCCCCFLGCLQWPRYKTYQHAHAHWREMHGNMPFVRQRPWPEPNNRINVPGGVPFTFPQVARQILVVAGIPLNTELGVLDQWVKHGRLFCACGNPNMPPPVAMDWVNLVSASHRRVFHSPRVEGEPHLCFGQVMHILLHKSLYHQRMELMR